jgi:glycosyltransferase involved in cell wall biosynthesis
MLDLASKTAIVVPVRNEAETIEDLLRSFETLTLKPREIIIVDGGSQDATTSVIKEYSERSKNLPYKVRLIETDHALPGKARNIGIESTEAKIIACTDAGCIVDSEWLTHLLEPFKESHHLDVVIGSCHPDAHSFFEECTFLATIKGLDKTRFVYFGAVSIAFTKDIWHNVGRYPEEIYPNEDKCFLTKLKNTQAKAFLSEHAIVRWRPRRNIREFFIQYFSYGRADARFGFVALRHSVRIVAYGLGLLMCVMGVTYPILWGIGAMCILVHAGNFTLSLYPGRTKKKRALMLLPLLLLVKDISQIMGYLLGRLERLCNPRYKSIAKEKFL